MSEATIYMSIAKSKKSNKPPSESLGTAKTRHVRRHMFIRRPMYRQHDKRSVCPRNKQNANTRVVLLLSHTPNYVLNLCNIAFTYHIDNVNIYHLK